MGERPTTTADVGSRRVDVLDVEPTELQRANPPPPPDEQRQPIRGQVVRELPKESKQVETTSILRWSDQGLGELFDALSQAQGKFGPIERTMEASIVSKKGVDSSYRYDYAPLDEVLQAVRPSLSEFHLSFNQFPSVGNGYVVVRTLLGHKGGGWMMNDLKMPGDTSEPKAAGSLLTYARRYSAMPILGVAPAVDDDAGAASPKGEAPRPGQRRSAPAQADRSAPAGPADEPKPQPSGRANGRGRAAAGEPAGAGTKETPPAAATPPAANQPAPAVLGQAAEGPAAIGRISELQEKPNGAIVVLETGFRAASKDAETTKTLKALKASNATVRLTTRPSSDPTRFAPVIVKVDITKREREPGEEG